MYCAVPVGLIASVPVPCWSDMAQHVVLSNISLLRNITPHICTQARRRDCVWAGLLAVGLPQVTACPGVLFCTILKMPGSPTSSCFIFLSSCFLLRRLLGRLGTSCAPPAQTQFATLYTVVQLATSVCHFGSPTFRQLQKYKNYYCMCDLQAVGGLWLPAAPVWWC